MTDLVKLKSFLHAAETLSFSEGAKHLHLTQPTVSHHIKSLEKDLGVELFIRSGSNIKLTEAGRLLLPWARKLIRQSIEMQEMMASLQQKIVGHLRLACSTTAGKYILPQLAARFCQRYPGVRISILTCTPEHVVPQLLEEEANLGVVSSYEVCGNEMQCQEFFRDSISLIVPANHPWAFRQAVEPEDLLEEPIIIREPTSGTRRVMLTKLAEYDITLDDLNVFLELGNAEAIVRTVAAGFGVSFVSTLATACSVERGYVVEVRVTGLELRRTTYMIRRNLEVPNRPQEVFWGFVHDPANADLLQLAEAERLA
ncbi:MAG: LysR family transcriptional regulator [Anaerolineae bacterium]|nr:LysR family transcriptional regulator [Anaerolineae bacterium]